MAIIKENVYGGPNIGVYLVLSNEYFMYPPKINPKLIEDVKRINPNVIAFETLMSGCSVLGSYVALNSHGMLIPPTFLDDEIEVLKKNCSKNFEIAAIETDHNAFGNLVLCNDKGAIISPKIADAKDIIEKTLKVPVIVMEFAKSDLPGACGLANNHGVVVHPLVTDEEAEAISAHLQVPIDVSTVNTGNPFIGGGAIVCDFGAIFGRDSTGPEIQRIVEVLELH